MIKASFTQTFATIREGSALQLRVLSFPLYSRVFGWFILFMAGASSLVMHKFHYMFLVTAAVGLFMALGHHICSYLGALQIRKAFEGKNFDFTFTEDGYEIIGQGSEAKNSWSNIFEILQNKKGFLIRVNKYAGIWLPLEALKTEEDKADFLSLIAKNGVKSRKI